VRRHDSRMTGGCGAIPGEEADEEVPMAARIDRTQLQGLLERGAVVLVEALGPMYFDDAHLPGAINIPLDRIDELAPLLLPDRQAMIVVYCSDRTCQTSEMASRRLEALGYRWVFEYADGKQDWIEHGLPVERAGEPADGGG
jgi:rhodanese-related sulfurtransferase